MKDSIKIEHLHFARGSRSNKSFKKDEFTCRLVRYTKKSWRNWHIVTLLFFGSLVWTTIKPKISYIPMLYWPTTRSRLLLIIYKKINNFEKVNSNKKISSLWGRVNGCVLYSRFWDKVKQFLDEKKNCTIS